jgi:hypothetical protein
MANNFRIGDRIKVKAYEKMPAERRTTGSARLGGKIGTVTDKLWSNGMSDFVYTIKLDDYDLESKKMWNADMLEPYIEEMAYEFNFSIRGGTVVASVAKDGKEIGSAWSHIQHDGEYGIVQAASYAMGVISHRMKEALGNEEN